jgi:hypothetical protein
MPKNMAPEFSGALSRGGPRPENRAVTPHDEFIAAFDRAVAARTLGSLVLSKRRQAAGDLESVRLRPVVLRGEAKLSFVYRHATRDITKNLDPAAARPAVVALLDPRRRAVVRPRHACSPTSSSSSCGSARRASSRW